MSDNVAALSDSLRETLQKIENDSNLREAIKREGLIVFAGAGISGRFGLPDWGSLVKMLISHLEQRTAVADEGLQNFTTLMEKNWLTPLQIISLLQKKYERQIIGFVQGRLRITGNQDFSLHKKILKLSEKIVTTNYDKAFERASENELPVVLNNNDFNIGQLQRMKGFLFKIHGDVDALQNCVFFEGQYNELYKSTPEHNAIRELKTFFIGRTLLFIGFGLNDPYIDEIFTTLSEQFKYYLDKHYIITTDENFKTSKHAKYIEPLLVGHYSEVDAVLDKILKIKEEEGPKPPLKRRKHNLRPRQYFSFIGREENIGNVMKRLKGGLPLVTIQGFPGVGKTSLATEVGYACVEQSTVKYADVVLFDYVVWIAPSDNPSGGHWLATVLDVIGRVMDNNKITDKPIDRLELKEAELASYLRNNEKQLLLILDNFEAIEDVELLHWITNRLPAPAKVLMTTSVNIPVKKANVDLLGLLEHDALKFAQQLIENEGEVSSKFPQERLLDLIDITNGNPRALELSVASIIHGKLNLTRIKEELDPDLGNIFENLHERSWSNLKESSKTVLSLFPQFIGSHSISKDASYKTCPLAITVVDQALSELLNWNLISLNPLTQRYTIHPITSRFVKFKLDPVEIERFKKRWSEYYLDFIRTNVIRESPKPIYWNALVSEKMNAIEEEWTAIQEVMQWADNKGQDELLIELVLLLVHFMDSRFYNQERIKFVRKAIAACEKNQQKRYEEALLRIDALGWTYAEESRFDDALGEIGKGLQLIRNLPQHTQETKDLQALANAWKARINLERGNVREASSLLEEAERFTDISPWIKTRIKMAEGDIEMQKEHADFRYAAACYLEAEKLTDPEWKGYGFEGQNYQINPRIGFAYIEIGTLEQDPQKANEHFEQAKERFENLERDDHIAIGRLYGRYGLARIAYEEGKDKNDNEKQQNAIQTIRSVSEEISQRAKSNLLKKLIERFLDAIGNG